MAKKTKEHAVEINNRKANFEYRFLDVLEAGIVLTGTEVKSLRRGNANLRDAYCFFRKGELYIKSLFIAEYDHGNLFNHEARRTRKLLLKRNQLRKLEKQLKEKGLTIVPSRLYINDRGFAKLEIALAQGKKVYDKRESIKQKDVKRDLDRIKKMY
ncbi:SsrA-binding protein SmpB [Phaeodactylibacter luteus]|uniref:SsrA-binding protein n=1 Tax=Phaeodactylibacter luteus TaxID=1564516 RepID=A0A5C6RGY3_9BACT|nr:SsrA-binding protein SmpB [Phaeodactylibacter luteus]TXB60573.1 SsrA-binding protein SmpB [Phaeodactylibacter luteus]